MCTFFQHFVTIKTFYLLLFFFSFLLYTGSPSNSFFIKVLTLLHILLHFCHSFSSSIKKADTLFQIKQQIMVQNDKKLCPLHSLSQEQYIIGLSFMAHMCKMIISAGFFSSFFFFFFFFFLNFVFLGCEWVKGQKMSPNRKKFCPWCSISQEPCIM